MTRDQKRAYMNSEQRRYARKKRSGICVRHGCKRRTPGGVLCVVHAGPKVKGTTAVCAEAGCHNIFVRSNSYHKRCKKCADKLRAIGIEKWRQKHMRTPEFRERRNRQGRELYAQNRHKVVALAALVSVRKFLRLVSPKFKSNTSFGEFVNGLTKNPALQQMGVTNERLEKAAGSNGHPDWRDECVEEKKEGDWVGVAQLARAVLQYRDGKKYKVAFRITRTKSRVFQTVWDFIAWQQYTAKKAA